MRRRDAARTSAATDRTAAATCSPGSAAEFSKLTLPSHVSWANQLGPRRLPSVGNVARGAGPDALKIPAMRSASDLRQLVRRDFAPPEQLVQDRTDSARVPDTGCSPAGWCLRLAPGDHSASVFGPSFPQRCLRDGQLTRRLRPLLHSGVGARSGRLASASSNSEL